MTDTLLRLGTHDLSVLAGLLRSGRLLPPFTGLALRPYVPASAAAAVASGLERLRTAGASPAAISILLETLAVDRDARGTIDEVLDLVATGPEAHGADHRDTRVVVENLFSSAERSVTVVGYAVYQGRQVFQGLAGRMEALPGLKVRMFLDVQRQRLDTTRDEDLVHAFAQRFREREWPGERMPEVYYDPRSLSIDAEARASLHAKCVVVDRAVAFISSANFTGAAQLKNIEIGVLVRSESFAERLAGHFDALVGNGILLRVPGL
ncbi:MAG: phospholipase [Gemmatimonadetes bacterium]|nr:phospholipase [Gemmatimonadota bacterium]